MDSGEPPPQSKFQAMTEFPFLSGIKNQPSLSTVLVKAPLDVSITGGSVLASSGLVQGGGSVQGNDTVAVGGDSVTATGGSVLASSGLVQSGGSVQGDDTVAGGGDSVTATGGSVTAGSPIAAVSDSVRGREVAVGGLIPVVDGNPSYQPSFGLGAWSKPLNTSSDHSASTLLMQTSKDLLAELSSESQWPSLSTATHTNQRRRQNVTSRTNVQASSFKSNDASDQACFQNSLEQVREYPWAAKMDKTKRNLHQVTTPEFLEDGTPKVRIPRHVLLEGLENQKEFVLGQFYRCSAPPSGLVQSVVNRIWGTKCPIYTRQLSDSSFLFHIPHEPTRKWVTQRGIWHVDDCILFVSAWNPAGTLALPEITTIPVWLTLKDIPHQLYSKKGISWIASGIGAPMLTSRPWLDPILMGEAKILVEVKLDRPFPQRVALEDEDGSVSMVTVIYSWLPSKCPKCGQLGHKAPRCLGLPPIPVFKDSRFVEPPQTRTPLSPPVTDPIHHGSTLVTEAQMTSHALSIDAQGCILLDQERNDEIPSNVPSEATAYNTDANVSTLQITHSASMETEAVPPISSPADNSTATNASPSDIACVPETTQLNTDSGFNGNITTSTSVSPSSSAPLDFATAGTLSLSTPVVDFKCKSSVDGIRDSCLQLSDAQGSNRFANLAMLEEDIQLDVVTSPSQPLSPSVKTSAQFVFNSSLPSTPPSFSDSFVDNVVASSSDSFDMVQRSRGGRCLKPSQKLKDMEWCTISGKGRRGRGTTPYSRRSH